MLGDYIDRGPNSKGIVDYLIEHPEIICIRGNHEQFLIDCFNPKTFEPKSRLDEVREQTMGWWLENGGIETLESYSVNYDHEDWLDCIPKNHVEWYMNLPTWYETEHYYFVHAGLLPGKSLDEQNDKNRLWIRYEFLNYNYFFGKYVVHGHSPLSTVPQVRQYRTNLDTGSVWENKQYIGIFDLEGGPNKPIELLSVELPKDVSKDPGEDNDYGIIKR